MLYVVAPDGSRIHVRPLWQVFLLSMATGALYQLYWAFVTARELHAARVASRARTIAWPATLLGSAVVVLWAAVDDVGAANRSAMLAIGVIAACWAAWDASSAAAQLQSLARVEADRWYRIRPWAAALLVAIGLGIGCAGVQPGDPEITGGALQPFDRAFAAWASGLLLPVWVLYVQHGLNEALKRMNPVSEAAESYGTLGGASDVESARIRARLAAHHSTQHRSEELDVVPWVTGAVAAICSLVFAWQVVSFGFALSLDDMRRSGASSVELVEGGDWWRLVTQHLVHFSVDHWAFNMFALLLGGWMLERAIGHRAMAAVVVASAAGATILSWFGASVLYGPAADEILAGGESGIGFGVIGALFAWDLHARTPAGRFGRWMAVIGAIGSFAPGVGLLAHAGGFIGGAAAVLALRRFIGPEGPEVVFEVFEAPVPVSPPELAAPPAIPAPPPTTPTWQR